MAPSRCAHTTSSHKKLERIQSLISFAKKATKEQLTTRLLDAWTAPECSITDVRILFFLGANPEALYENKEGDRLLEEREVTGTVCSLCSPKYQEFLQYAKQIYDAQFNSTPIRISQKRLKTEKRKLFAVSLDGGGMRGLVSITCLLFASRRLLGDESLPNLADWFVGCSTGSMLSLALAKGNSLTDTFFLYWEMKNEIFLDKSTMKRLFGNVVEKQTARVEGVLDRVFGDEKDTFAQCPKRLTVPTLDICTTPGRLHVFRNYPVRNKKTFEDVKLRDAARASSAAPTYFNAHEMGDHRFVDGSLVANCPLNVLFAEYDKSLQAGQSIQLGLVFSIGTGEPAESKRRYRSGTSIGRRGRHLADLAVLLMEQVVGHEKSVIQSAEDRCAASGIPFTRICPVGINVRIDQIDDGKLIDMVWSSLLWLHSNIDLIDEFGEKLVDLLGAPTDSSAQKLVIPRRHQSVGPQIRRERRQTTS
ncbi:hypothetical protein M3Y94_00233500 [Aphelenchoides besseyi]|nr:hypothetical protein M3Y94_00233500 [Aphelenchoides besseyi]KAI6236417.1 85/88 kDa calcium-independent phospholipase A2 [Aphelenchoides besseyi]